MLYRHDYVLAVAWGVTCLVALLALLLVGARVAGWDVLGSAAGSALLGSIAGALAGLFSSPDPDSFPVRAVLGAVVGAVAFGLAGLAVRPSDPPRRFKALASGCVVVVALVVLEVRAAAELVLGWTQRTPGGPCHAPDPSHPLRDVVACVPKFSLWAQRLLALDIALLAFLFLLQGMAATYPVVPDEPPDEANGEVRAETAHVTRRPPT